MPLSRAPDPPPEFVYYLVVTNGVATGMQQHSHGKPGAAAAHARRVKEEHPDWEVDVYKVEMYRINWERST